NQDEGKREKPIDVDTYNQQELEITFNEDVDEDEDEEFEDVPIEGLNRFPQLPYREAGPGGQLPAQYQREQRPEAEADDSLFVGADVDALFEEPGLPQDEADEDLQRAIQMSLEQPAAEQEPIPTWSTASATAAQAPLPAGKQDTNVFEPVEEEEEEEGDLFAALTKAKAPAAPREPVKPPAHPFGGPLPFESLKFNYQKKPTKPAVDEEAGGFDKTTATEQGKEGDEKKAAMPLPPWFEQKSQRDTFIDGEKDDQYSGLNKYKPSTNIDEEAVLQKERPAQVINLDDEEEETQETKDEVINLESEDEVQETPAQQPVTQPVVPRVTPPKPEDVVIPAKEEPAADQARTSPRPAADQDHQEPPSVEPQASPRSKSSSPEFEDVELATPRPADLDITAGELV
ncbi:DNA repair protein rad2, partial [Ascosphaera atra]